MTSGQALALAGTAVGALLLSAPGALRGQTSRADPTDVQSWYAATLRLNLPHRWETSLQYRARLVDNASHYHGSYGTVEVQRGVGKHLALLGSYRLAVVEGGTYHRFAGGAEAAARLGATRLSFRPLLQYQKQYFEGDDEQSADADTYLRARTQARWTIARRLAFYSSVEPYWKLDGGARLDNLRNTAGVRYELTRGTRIDLCYIYRPDYGKSYDRTFHVIAVDVDFALRLGGRHDN